MKKNTNLFSLFLSTLLFMAAMLFFSGCSSNKQYFSFTPAPPAYVKKPVATPVKSVTPETDNTSLTASAAPDQAIVLPEVTALKTVKAQPALAQSAAAPQGSLAPTEVKTKQKLTLAQKVVLHKVQKQVKKLSNTGKEMKAAAGPVTNRNAIALILIGLVVAIVGSLLAGTVANLFYTLGVLILLVGLVLLILNYV